MFCANCGNEVEQYARFCSRCGKEVRPAASLAEPRHEKPNDKPHDMAMHLRTLAWVFIGSAALLGLAGIAIIFAGHMIQHFPPALPPHFPMRMLPFAGWMSAIAGLATLAFAGGVAAAGAGLLQH